MRKNLFEVRHPIFLPLWRRVLVAAVLVGWTLLEVAVGSGFWALIVGASTMIVIWAFFVTFDPEEFRNPPE